MGDGEEEIYDDNISIEEAEYSPKSEFSKAKITEEAVRKCIEARSSEMREGYYNYKTDNSGNFVKVWIPDTRKIYIGAVLALRNLLSPELKRNKNYLKTEEELNEKQEKLFNKLCYTEYVRKVIDEELRVIKSDRKFIPERDAMLLIINPITNTASEKKGYWNSKVSAYWQGMVEICDELFASLNELIDSLNYFKAQISY
jgi:hypothetical protein